MSILSKCANFEQKANYLLKLAENLASNSFYTKFSKLFANNITNDDVDSWIDENSNILEHRILNLNWNIFNGEFLIARDSSYPEISYEISISKSKTSSSPITEAILTPFNKIPRLYFYEKVSEQDDIKPNLDLSKDAAHNKFIIDFFEEKAKVESVKLTTSFYQKINDFCIDFATNIANLKKSFAKSPTILGSGSDGTTFDIGGGKVLKLFSDQTAYNSTKKSMDLLFTRPNLANTEVMIYDVGKLGFIGRFDVFYSILEKLNTKNVNENWYDSAISLLVDAIMSSFKANNIRLLSKLIEENKDKKAKILVDKMVNEVKSQIIKDNTYNDYVEMLSDLTLPDGSKLDNSWFTKLVLSIAIKLATGRADLHAGNIGISNNELKYFDPSYSYRDGEWKEFIENKDNNVIDPKKIFKTFKSEHSAESNKGYYDSMDEHEEALGI